MNFTSFKELLQQSLPDGTVLQNPGGGTTTVAWCDGERLSYRRGRSLFYVGLEDLHGAYAQFCGGPVTTSDLKAWHPGVFDSSDKGHNCNCTVLFLALRQMGLADQIWGRGRRGEPFGVNVV